MDSGSPATSGRPRARKSRRERANEAERKARARPLLESPGLILWLVIVDAVAVHIVWLLTATTYTQTTILHLGLLSLATFLLFGVDKWRAGRAGRRVSEMNLIVLAFAGGAAGGLLGMALFRHKLKGLKFRLALPAALFLHVAMLLVMSLSES